MRPPLPIRVDDLDDRAVGAAAVLELVDARAPADVRAVLSLLRALERVWAYSPSGCRGVALAHIDCLRRRVSRRADTTAIFDALRSTQAFREPFRRGEVSLAVNGAMPPQTTWTVDGVRA